METVCSARCFAEMETKGTKCWGDVLWIIQADLESGVWL